MKFGELCVCVCARARARARCPWARSHGTGSVSEPGVPHDQVCVCVCVCVCGATDVASLYGQWWVLRSDVAFTRPGSVSEAGAAHGSDCANVLLHFTVSHS